MKIMIEMEGNDPRLAAVIAAIQGTPVVGVPTVPKDPVKPAEAPKGNVEETPVEKQVAQDPPKTSAPSQEPASAPAQTEAPKAGEVTLAHLQSLAAQLLQAGERRTLKSILDENGVKSLSTAPEDAYDMLFGALTDAVSGLAAS